MFLTLFMIYFNCIKKYKEVNNVKKTLTIIGGIVVGLVVLGVIIFFAVSATSKKLVCKSNEGNITIMYND